ncbi:amidohydrolase, partial [Turicibacter sanguinis]|nr:amidohydrolase [Turicibacter sanguinis]
VYPLFNELFKKIATEVGLIVEDINHNESKGSTDAGNVSHVIPTIHPSVKICDSEVVTHTEEFKQAAISKQGDEGLLQSAEILARIGLRLLSDGELLAQIKEEFELNKVR